MKKLIFTILALFLIIPCANAEKIEFNGEVYDLQYATKTATGFVNEYVRNFEHTDDWNKIVIVNYFTNTDDAAEYMDKYAKQIKMLPNYTFQGYDNIKKILSFNTNYFNTDYFEYNILKAKKHSTQGILCLQYIEKYYFVNARDMNNQLTKAKVVSDKIFKAFDAHDIPEIVQQEIDKF